MNDSQFEIREAQFEIVELTDEDLAEVAGAGRFVAVKTISWSYDDEAPKETIVSTPSN